MDDKVGKEKAKNYYDQEAKDYIKRYSEEYKKYPANLVRINFIIKRLKENKAKTVLDAGCGTCGPILKLLKEGFTVNGFDFSKEMVREGRKVLKAAGYDPSLIFEADLEDSKTLPKQKFDAIIALGVFPHIINERKALNNMKKLLNKNGSLFIEFRNELFAAFTMNKYSVDFFLNKIIDIKSLPKEIAGDLIDFYTDRFKVDKPIKKKDGTIEYTDILARFKNPLTIEQDLFAPEGLKITKIHFYHFHALPPIFENKYPGPFRELSFKMEKTDDWRGYLMSSAYVIEAKLND